MVFPSRMSRKAVSIQLLLLFYIPYFLNAFLNVPFQYNFCYCSISICSPDIANNIGVSIQLLLLFYAQWILLNGIMFCFNTTFVTVLSKRHTEDLQNIPRFNTTFVTVLSSVTLSQIRAASLFQYNFCYCSMMAITKVTAAVAEFQYNFCYCSIKQFSIVDMGADMFQYNFCYCSIRIFTGFLFYYITRYPLKIKIF